MIVFGCACAWFAWVVSGPGHSQVCGGRSGVETLSTRCRPGMWCRLVGRCLRVGVCSGCGAGRCRRCVTRGVGTCRPRMVVCCMARRRRMLLRGGSWIWSLDRGVRGDRRRVDRGSRPVRSGVAGVRARSGMRRDAVTHDGCVACVRRLLKVEGAPGFRRLLLRCPCPRAG